MGWWSVDKAEVMYEVPGVGFMCLHVCVCLCACEFLSMYAWHDPEAHRSMGPCM